MSWDAIVIGAGTNGLVAAQYLARAGRRVLVVEQRRQPDSRPDTGWVPAPIVRDLRLADHGLRIDLPDPWITAPLPAGGTLALSRDLATSVANIRRISPHDADRWPDFCARMRRVAGVLERLYLAPPPDIEAREPGELVRLARLGLHVRRLGKQTMIDLARILPMSIAELLDEWFEHDTLKGLLGAVGVWHLKQGPRSGGTAFNFLHHHAGSAPGVFRPPRSNVGQVLTALPSGRRGSVEVRRGDGPARVLASGGRVRGVALGQRGEMMLAPVVVSSADPRAALRDVVAELDPEFARAVRHIKCRGVVARGTVQLTAPIDYSRVCFAPSLEQLERAYDDAKYGRDSTTPYVEAVASAGETGTLDVHVQYVPMRDGADPDGHAALRQRVAGLLGADPQAVRLETPEERQRLHQLTEGHLYHGELTLDQILFMRPVPGWSRYRTPVAGLYLCGPGTHPGGGIPGGAGRNAAQVILGD